MMALTLNGVMKRDVKTGQITTLGAAPYLAK